MRPIELMFVLGALASLTLGGVVSGEEMVLTVDLPAECDYQLEETLRGQKLGFEDCGYKAAPGSPMLPTRTFLIALPPGTRAGLVGVNLAGGQDLLEHSRLRLLLSPFVWMEAAGQTCPLIPIPPATAGYRLQGS